MSESTFINSRGSIYSVLAPMLVMISIITQPVQIVVQNLSIPRTHVIIGNHSVQSAEDVVQLMFVIAVILQFARSSSSSCLVLSMR